MIETLQNILIYGGSFIAVLSVVVFVHEFGHFQAARWCGMSIEAFSIGFGRAMARWRDKHGVEWKIGVLPLGGYVKFTDDSDVASTGPREGFADSAARAEARRRGIFHAQPIWKRAIVIAAGPGSNFLFAILAFALVLFVMGRDVTDRMDLSPRIDAVMEGSAAANAGLRPGDVIVAANHIPVTSFGAFQQIINARPGEPTVLSVRRGGDQLDMTATPGSRDVPDETGTPRRLGFLGIERRTLPSERQIERVGPVEAIGAGANQTWMIVALTGGYIRDIFAGRQSAEHIAGPVGILNESGRIASAALGVDKSILEKLQTLLLSLVQWAAALSVAVGFTNLLPVPILDGGHLVLYAAEALRGGKPLPAVVQEWAFKAGALMLGALFLFATWNDIQRHFG